jgi:hypothetical protein
MPETSAQVNWVKSWPQRRRSVRQWVIRDRYRGTLLGLAAGDVLGTTLEFKTPGTFKPLTDMIGGGPFGLEPGSVDRRHLHGPLSDRELTRDARFRPEGSNGSLLSLVEGGISR